MTNLTQSTPSWLRQVSQWSPGASPRVVDLHSLDPESGFLWFDVVCSAAELESVLKLLGEHCDGLTEEMLADLLTPDDEPEGSSYGNGRIRLASSFSVVAERPDRRLERGRPEGVGVLSFQPVELLAGDDWLITCRHPQRVFQGAERVEEKPAGDAEALFLEIARKWERCSGRTPGDLGVAVMHELSLSYAPTHRSLHTWLEDWELSLYIDDGLDNHDQLPELWGLMAVLRNWLTPLNKPGLRADIGKAWLPASDHAAVIDVDERVDKALAALAKLSETLRQSFGLLHLEQTEEQRQRTERMQHRIEAAAAVFLVPTLIVGFYGANTWVPGQGRHWGFWVMVVILVILSVGSLLTVLHLQRRSSEANEVAAAERRRLRSELLRGS